MEPAGRRLRFLFILFVILVLLIILINNTPPRSSGGPSFPVINDPHSRPFAGRQNELTAASLRPHSAPRDHSTDSPRHPLDPLTVGELNRVHEIVKSHAIFAGKAYALHSVVLEEPPKEAVLRWRSQGGSHHVIVRRRKASVVARVGGENYVLTVDLETGEVVRREMSSSVTAGYPMVTAEDMSWVGVAPFTHVEFNRTVVRRGVDLADVVCLPLAPGWFGQTEEENKRRLIKVQCFSKKDTANFYMRPIEGITTLVDLDAKRVLRISDRGRGRIPTIIPSGANTEYRYTAQSAPHPTMGLNPISIEQPKGPSFTVEDNHMVKWANWEFHLKPDPRAGVIVSSVMFRDPDSGERRSVLYKGMTSELFVPYMDPSDAWYFKTYMDAGEYGFGLLAMSLDRLNDCPRHAYYMDGVFAAADGTPYVQPDLVCIFERYAGDIGWRHSESPIIAMEVREARPKVTLVVRMVSTVGNYDYIVDWEFQNDGLVRIKVGLSGMLNVKGTSYTNMNEVPSTEELYGTLLPGNLIGTTHDHFITFYLDMDVDGSDNSFVKINLKREPSPDQSSPRKSYLKAVRHVAKTEKDAQVKLKLYDPYEFHLINPNKKTQVGNPVGYKVVPAGTAASLLDPEDPPQKRAGFTDNQIWITPYNRNEEWAGGLFAYQSRGEDTLATWTERDRPVENKDIVLWYTLGFHHIPCQEDFPVMPTVSSSFDLKPANFFGRNPILYIPPSKEEDLPVCEAAASVLR